MRRRLNPPRCDTHRGSICLPLTREVAFARNEQMTEGEKNGRYLSLPQSKIKDFCQPPRQRGPNVECVNEPPVRIAPGV